MSADVMEYIDFKTIHDVHKYIGITKILKFET